MAAKKRQLHLNHDGHDDMLQGIGAVSTLPWRFPSSANSSVLTARGAVLFLGRCLSYDHSDHALSTLRRQLSDPSLDWLMVIDIACRNGLTPALLLAMERKALVDELPTDLQRYLAMIHGLNRRRNEIIREEAHSAIVALAAGGLRPILMKGALGLFDGESDRGLRMMTDIDMLLSEQEMEKACSILSSMGYFLFGQPRRYDHAHAWTFHRSGSLVTIDLHRHVGPQREILATEIARNNAVPSADDSSIWELCPTHSALLQVMTFAIFERFYRLRQIPLRGLHDLASLCHHRQREIDWSAIAYVAEGHDFAPATHAFLHMARRIFSVPVPPILGRTPRAYWYLQQSLLYQSLPAAQRTIRAWNRLAWPLDRFRMHYRYRCGTRGLALHLARIHHATGVLRRRLGWWANYEAELDHRS
jgi:Uncharacterised nucleotidyltransferase